MQDEIIVNEERDLSEDTWADRMLVVAKQLFRVLKPGRWLTLCYHDTSEGTWALVQNIMENVGFVSDNSEAVVFIETRQKSIKQITADKVNKRDLVINFRKPKPGEDRPSRIHGAGRRSHVFAKGSGHHLRVYSGKSGFDQG